jgi:thiol-disulfide isomerase/thioredoxin
MLHLSKKAWLLLAFLMAVVVFALGLVYYVYLSPTGLRARESSDLGKSTIAVPIRYTDMEGNSIDLRSYESEILIVNVWASWSPFTSHDHEILRDLKAEFGDAITIRAVNRMESKETAKAYLDSIGTQEGIEYVIDTTDYLFVSQGGYAMPETLMFDRIGNLKGHIRGVLDAENVRRTIKEILGSE